MNDKEKTTKQSISDILKPMKCREEYFDFELEIAVNRIESLIMTILRNEKLKMNNERFTSRR